MKEEQQGSPESEDSNSFIPIQGRFVVGAPLSIYLLGILVERIELPWRAVFYEVPFQDLKASMIAHLPGLPLPIDAGDDYALFRITGARGEVLCTMLLRNLNRGLYQMLRKISVELRISGTSSPACIAIVHGLIKGITTDFGNAGTVHIQGTIAPQDSPAAPEEATQRARFTMLFGLKNEDRTLTAKQLSEKYLQLTGDFLSEDTILGEFRKNGVKWERGKRTR